MTKYLLYSKSSNITARLLAKQLGLRATRRHKHLPHDSVVAIRYGHRFGVFREDTDSNSPSVIRMCADSVSFQEFCRDVGIYCPQYLSPKSVDVPHSFPVFVRKRRHFGGKDIQVAHSLTDLHDYVEPDSFLVFPAKVQYEIRIHMVAGEVARIFKKVGDADTDYPVRTAHNGWKYSLVLPPYGDRYSKARELCTELARSMNLAFGAVDLGYDQERKEYIVFEVNTAPGLANNANTLGVYLNYFRGLLGVR